MREGLLQAGQVPLELELAGRLAGALTQRFADPLHRLLAPAFDGRRVDAEAPGKLIHRRLARQKLQHCLSSILSTPPPRTAPVDENEIPEAADYPESMARQTTPSLNRAWDWLLEMDRLRGGLSGRPEGLSEPSPLPI